MKHLSWFLGPKGENSDFLIESITTILQDYVHWRRNYYPSDTILIDKKIQRENEAEFDRINLGLLDMVAKLRRNFPFYSPRYIAHMLSDVSIPATLGYIAGMLHNSNNCTPEAAPVTVEWEIEACNNILEMIGFTPSPKPPLKDSLPNEWEKYKNKLKEEFGWAHITSGGTVANIEALWVARIIKYYPLAIQDVAIEKELDIEIKLPSHTEKKPVKEDIKVIKKRDLLFIKPNESIYLFSRFINALRKKLDISVSEANKLSSELLKRSEYSLSNNMGKIFAEFPPVVFCSGTAHYSIKKASDLLGIGSANAVLVNMDSDFRLDIADLKRKIDLTIQQNKIPLAVIAVAGTTEEGAVDPIHEVVDLRKRYEEDNKSFWLHIDSAWGGYVSSIFKLSKEEELDILMDKIYFKISGKKYKCPNLNDKMLLIVSTLLEKVSLLREERTIERQKMLKSYKEEIQFFIKNNTSDTESLNQIRRLKEIVTKYSGIVDFLKKEDFSSNLKSSLWKVSEEKIETLLDIISEKISGNKVDGNIKEKINFILKYSLENTTIAEDFKIESYSRKLENIKNELNNHKIEAKQFIDSLKKISEHSTNIESLLQKEDFVLTIEDRSDLVSGFVKDKVNFSLDYKKRYKTIGWGGKPLVSSFLAFKSADSITIDPHKLGYVPYPCGVIAFRNDRVRHFIMQRAPYITSSKHNVLLHNPPQHIKEIDFKQEDLLNTDYDVAIDAFAPFILEGSKPGAAASALWFSSKMIPLNRKNHGAIIRESIIAARELHEWISTWKKICDDSRSAENMQYEFKTFCSIPDTNVFVFAIKGVSDNTLKGMNALINDVYENFSIQVEQGSRKHSYSQSFFLSKTIMDDEHYKYEVFKNLFESWGIKNASTEYKKNGLIVLRAAVMNPYIATIRRNTDQNLIKEFVLVLHKCANKCAISAVKSKK